MGQHSRFSPHLRAASIIFQQRPQNTKQPILSQLSLNNQLSRSSRYKCLSILPLVVIRSLRKRHQHRRPSRSSNLSH